MSTMCKDWIRLGTFMDWNRLGTFMDWIRLGTFMNGCKSERNKKRNVDNV